MRNDCILLQVVVRIRPMNDRELFTSDATVVQVDEQDPQQMQVGLLQALMPDFITQSWLMQLRASLVIQTVHCGVYGWARSTATAGQSSHVNKHQWDVLWFVMASWPVRIKGCFPLANRLHCFTVASARNCKSAATCVSKPVLWHIGSDWKTSLGVQSRHRAYKHQIHYSKFLIYGQSLQGRSQCKDKEAGNQILHFDCNSTPE